MYLRNVIIYLRIHIASQPRSETQPSLPPWETHFTNHAAVPAWIRGKWSYIVATAEVRHLEQVDLPWTGKWLYIFLGMNITPCVIIPRRSLIRSGTHYGAGHRHEYVVICSEMSGRWKCLYWQQFVEKEITWEKRKIRECEWTTYLCQGVARVNFIHYLKQFYGLDDRAIEVRSPAEARGFFPLSSVSRPALGPTQPPVQWVPQVFLRG
jgi:hypothetical protein